MLWLGHVLSTWFLMGTVNLETALWAIGPDVPMALFLAPSSSSWSDIRNWEIYKIAYKFPHTVWSLAFIPKKARPIWAFHILMDILSHTGQWSIEPFFPWGPPVHGIWDPMVWT